MLVLPPALCGNALFEQHSFSNLRRFTLTAKPDEGEALRSCPWGGLGIPISDRPNLDRDHRCDDDQICVRFMSFIDTFNFRLNVIIVMCVDDRMFDRGRHVGFIMKDLSK